MTSCSPLSFEGRSLPPLWKPQILRNSWFYFVLCIHIQGAHSHDLSSACSYSNGWKWLSSMLHALISLTPEKQPPDPLHRKLGRPQSQSGCCDEDKNPYPCWESNPGCPASSLVTILTELSQLLSTVLKKILRFKLCRTLSLRVEAKPPKCSH
jgi:hypothetical protein